MNDEKQIVRAFKYISEKPQTLFYDSTNRENVSQQLNETKRIVQTKTKNGYISFGMI